MKAKRISIVLLVLFFSFAVLVTTSSAAAIFTSRGDGTGVNINLYDDKCAVFLNGGPPPHGDCFSSGLTEGCYVYQVTAPPGGGQNETLLSQDSIKKRFIKVSGGVFVHDDGTCAAAADNLTPCGTPTVEYDDCGDASQGFVNTGIGEKGHDAGDGKCEASIPGNISARLMPFADTTNNGGVYKVYATMIGDYDNNCEGVFGFIHDNSKTDNFRVKPSGTPPPPQQGEIDVLKFCDANANGIIDPAELLFGLSGWQIDITLDGCSGQTDVNGLFACPNLNPGTYNVAETIQSNFNHTATCVDGYCGYCSATQTTLCNIDADCPATETCVPNGPASASITITGDDRHNVDFGNVGLSEINGRKFNDTNADGIDNTEPGIAGVKILLSGTAANGTSVSQCTVTGGDGSYSFSNLLPGTYTVSEVKPAGTVATTPISCEKILTVSTEQDENDIITCEGATAGCSFGNVCLGKGGGLTLGYWSNKNGQGKITGTDLCSLNILNLKKGITSDSNFDPVNGCPAPSNTQVSAGKTALKNWLLSATATNMSYMLSAQFAAMNLNVLHNFVSGSAIVYAGTAPAGCTVSGLSGLGFISINDLLSGANTELGADGYTPAGDPERKCQEFKKNALDNANNNKNFIVPCPTDYGATCL
jgi:hypothetical protein